MANDMKYLETHEWARQEAGLITVGISEFAVQQLGDIVFLELPAVGKKIQKGAAFGSIESVKAASDLYAPVSGQVVEVNSALPDNPELFKTDPHGQAWMIKVKPSNPADWNTLLDAAIYEKQAKEHH